MKDKRHQRIWNVATAIMLLLLTACMEQPKNVVHVHQLPPIFPDYIGVTIPVDIAPLDFDITDDEVTLIDVIVKGSKGGQIHVQGSGASFDIGRWHELTEQNRGGHLTLTVCTKKNGKWTQYDDFDIYVSPMPLDDYGVTYRRIAPGYEVGGNIGIYQRDIHTFCETPILQESMLPGRCFNCHTANRTNPQQLTMQIRGEGGGTLIQLADGRQHWLNTRTDSTKAAGSYAYWHPSGNYCAYATNAVHQSFFVGTGQRIEAYHDFSNIVVLDVRSNELLLAPQLMTDTDLEIYPAFSADGRWLYYSTSKYCRVPAEYEKVKCSLCRIAFDPDTGTFGNEVDTLLNGPRDDRSYTLVRPSYDGRWLMYCTTSRSNFAVFHKDADLWLMDTKTGKTRPITEANSDNTDSYHNWSSNSHWFVFSSKRTDGMYAQLFFASIDAKGRVSKPFLLPQRHPKRYYRDMMDSYNCPDFTLTRVEFDAHEANRQVFDNQRVQVKIRDKR